MLKATVSGSFHRHMAGIYEAVGSLREAGLDVLSPSDPRVVDHLGDFLFVASDKLRSVKLVQDRHLHAIRASDFLWVVCPDGYTGPSVSMEIGAAFACGVPVFCSSPAVDITLGAYVKRVAGLRDAIAEASTRRRPTRNANHILLDPSMAVERVAEVVDRVKPYLLGRLGDGRGDPEREMAKASRLVRDTFSCAD